VCYQRDHEDDYLFKIVNDLNNDKGEGDKPGHANINLQELQDRDWTVQRTSSQEAQAGAHPVDASHPQEPKENEQTPSKPVQEIEEIQDNFNFTSEQLPVIRRFILSNNSSFTVVVRLQIVPKNNEFLNFRIPASIFQMTARPKSQQQVLSIMKIFPNMPWGEYEINSNIQKLETKIVPNSQKNEKYGGSDEENQKKKNANFQIRPIDMSKLERGDDEKKCKRCSVTNSPTNSFCKQCGNEFK